MYTICGDYHIGCLYSLCYFYREEIRKITEVLFIQTASRSNENGIEIDYVISSFWECFFHIHIVTINITMGNSSLCHLILSIVFTAH